MIEYYSQRAHEYERIYHKPERQADLVRLREHLRRAVAGRRVLELACGTGFWTAAIADCAELIHAADDLQHVLAPFVDNLVIATFEYFWCATYETKPSSQFLP